MSEVQAVIDVLGRFWEDPKLTELNRLPARALTTSYRNEDDARAGARPWEHSLDGQWGFSLVDSPADAPKGWTTKAIAKRSTVEVPGNWTMQDTGDYPHYTNVIMPFAGNPPEIPAKNPAGLYRQNFELPRGWKSRKTILHLGGVEATAAIWLNGTFVGIATDSRLPSEFDLTPYLKDGANKLAVLVPRWCAATWIEDQDHWFHGGIHRCVKLISRAKTALRDVAVTTTLATDKTSGSVAVSARVDGNTRGWTVKTRLERLNGRGVRNGTDQAEVSQMFVDEPIGAMIDAYRHPGPIASTNAVVQQIKPWTHETPHRYRVLVSLVNPKGKVTEVVPVITGFKSVLIDGPELLLNGEPLNIAGVNRHDHHPTKGKAATPEELREDVANIKRCGFNAVRTSHYPPDPAVFEACDEFGLWVVAEANVESHARWEEIVHDPNFEHSFVERVQRMVTFHRNHPSIFAWSLGNEAGDGPVQHGAANWVRSTDPSRVVQYEGGVMHWWQSAPGASHESPSTDINCPMYPPIARIKDLIKEGIKTPMIMCEYSHAMGNSNGDLDLYWDLIHSTRGLQGGFIWDWKDQGLLTTDRYGREYYGYGGAFGDKPNDAAFCCNGIVDSEGNPHPGVEEHRKLTQPITTTLAANGTLTINNGRSYSDLTDLVATAVYSADGHVVAKRKLAVPDTAAGKSSKLKLKIPKDLLGDEARVTIEWRNRRATDWAERGHRVAWDQHELAAQMDMTEVPAPTITTSESDTQVVANAGPLEVAISKETGRIESIQVAGKEVLASAPQAALWRAPVDNDGVLVGSGAGIMGATSRWLGWGLDSLTRSERVAEVKRTRSSVRVNATQTITTGADKKIGRQSKVTLERTGAIRFDEVIVIPESLDDLPRVGVELTLAKGFDQLRWFGLGPEDTYPDRLHSQVGIWSSSVADQYHAYVTPQHHGSHFNTRWAELTNKDGVGVRLELDGLTFDASHHNAHDLTKAAIPPQLKPQLEVFVHIDAAIRGVGTAACGPDTTSIVKGGTYKFRWRLLPVT